MAYANLAKARDERKRYQPDHVNKAICRSLMLRILAFQKTKRDFYRKRVYTNKVNVVTHQEARRILPLGELEEHGKLEIVTSLKQIFKEFEVWTDFIQRGSKWS